MWFIRNLNYYNQETLFLKLRNQRDYSNSILLRIKPDAGAI